MNDYYSVRVNVSGDCSEDITDIMAAYLADVGFESFEPDSTGVTAYIPAAAAADSSAEKIAAEALSDLPINCDFSISQEFIEGQDWNEEWEKHYFKPILIDGRCAIHSSFHTDVPDAEYDIVIDPKMAFGTGHHDTTSQMVRHILDSDIRGKDVIDMGTGTGILAILAKMAGARNVTGIEIDAPAYENAIDNAVVNGVEIRLIHGDASALEGLHAADFLFANINRNIILADIDRYASRLAPGGYMLLSGFYEEDIPLIEEACRPLGLTEVKRLVSNRWCALKLHRNDA